MSRPKPIVQYKDTVQAVFVRRVNRFVAEVMLNAFHGLFVIPREMFDTIANLKKRVKEIQRN